MEMTAEAKQQARRPREGGDPASLTLFVRNARKRDEEDDHDEYYEYEEERPSVEPVDRPTDERGERPMRSPVSPRWGPNRRNSR